MKICHDCGQPIAETLWRCQDCFSALWPKRPKRFWSRKDQRRFLERLALQKKEEIERRRAEERRDQELALQDGQEKSDAKEKGKIYFISDEHDRIKIGYSNYPKRRLKALQSHNPDILTLLVTVPGDRETENSIQTRFTDFQIRETEWFTAAPALLDYIEWLCNISEGLKAAAIKPRA